MPDHPPSALAVDVELAKARDECLRQGERWTDPRRIVLQMLLTAGRPLKAYDLLLRLNEQGSPPHPPTVYRALEFLTERGFVHRIESEKAFVVCTASPGAHVAALLICTCCGNVDETPLDSSEATQRQAARTHFQVERVVFELRGICQGCG